MLKSGPLRVSQPSAGADSDAPAPAAKRGGPRKAGGGGAAGTGAGTGSGAGASGRSLAPRKGDASERGSDGESRISAAAAALARDANAGAPRPAARSRLEAAAGGALLGTVDALKKDKAALSTKVEELEADVREQRERAHAAELRAEALQQQLHDEREQAAAAPPVPALAPTHSAAEPTTSRANDVAAEARRLADQLASMQTGPNDPAVTFAPTADGPKPASADEETAMTPMASSERMASIRKRVAQLKTGKTPAGVRWNTNMVFIERTPSSVGRHSRTASHSGSDASHAMPSESAGRPVFGSPLDDVDSDDNCAAPSSKAGSCSPESGLSVGVGGAPADSAPDSTGGGGFPGFDPTPSVGIGEAFGGFDTVADEDKVTPPQIGAGSMAVPSSDTECDDDAGGRGHCSPEMGSAKSDELGFSDSDFMSASKFFANAGADNKQGLKGVESMLPNVVGDAAAADKLPSGGKAQATRTSSEDSGPHPQRISFSGF